MKVPQGIEVRHQHACGSRNGGRCDCRPNFRVSISTGRGKPRVRKSFDKLADAKQWQEDARVDLRRGVIAPPSAPKLSSVAEKFMDGARRGTNRNRSGRPYKPSTLRGYEQALADYVLPTLGSRRISELRRGDVQRLVDKLVDSELSASTVRNALLPLRAICRRALVRGDLATNPTHGLELPAVTGKRDRVATPKEAAALIAALPTSDRPIWATAFYAGLRLGEIQALRARDIDLERSVLRIERTWDRVEGPVPPKSAAGIRLVPIARVLRPFVEALAATDDRLAFGRSPDVPFSPSGVVDRAHRIWTAAGLDPITPHECRHTFASLMIAAGVNVKALQVFMGHSSITVTFDRYGHLLPGSESEAADLLDAYIATETKPIRGATSGQHDPGPRPP